MKLAILMLIIAYEQIEKALSRRLFGDRYLLTDRRRYLMGGNVGWNMRR